MSPKDKSKDLNNDGITHESLEKETLFKETDDWENIKSKEFQLEFSLSPKKAEFVKDILKGINEMLVKEFTKEEIINTVVSAGVFDVAGATRFVNGAIIRYNSELNKNLLEIKALDNIIKSNKDNVFAWYKKGSILYELKKYDEAIECLDESIRLNSGFTAARDYKDLAIEKLKNQKESIRNSINTNGNRDIKIIDRKLVIKFYDDIKKEEIYTCERLLAMVDSGFDNSDNIKENKISVNYSGSGLSVDIIAKDFIGYWKKIVYNLGEENQFGYNLERNIEEMIKKGIKKDDDIFREHRNDINIKIINECRRSKKNYISTLQTHPKIPFSLVNLKVSWGGENTYAPLTVFSFLHHIVQNLSINELKNFNDVIKLYPKEGLDFYIKNY